MYLMLDSVWVCDKECRQETEFSIHYLLHSFVTSLFYMIFTAEHLNLLIISEEGEIV